MNRDDPVVHRGASHSGVGDLRTLARVNAPFLAGGSGEEFRAGIKRAVALGWLWRHESGTYLKCTGSGAALFA